MITAPTKQVPYEVTVYEVGLVNSEGNAVSTPMLFTHKPDALAYESGLYDALKVSRGTTIRVTFRERLMKVQ